MIKFGSVHSHGNQLLKNSNDPFICHDSNGLLSDEKNFAEGEAGVNPYIGDVTDNSFKYKGHSTMNRNLPLQLLDDCFLGPHEKFEARRNLSYEHIAGHYDPLVSTQLQLKTFEPNKAGYGTLNEFGIWPQSNKHRIKNGAVNRTKPVHMIDSLRQSTTLKHRQVGKPMECMASDMSLSRKKLRAMFLLQSPCNHTTNVSTKSHNSSSFASRETVAETRREHKSKCRNASNPQISKAEHAISLRPIDAIPEQLNPNGMDDEEPLNLCLRDHITSAISITLRQYNCNQNEDANLKVARPNSDSSNIAFEQDCLRQLIAIQHTNQYRHAGKPMQMYQNQVECFRNKQAMLDSHQIDSAAFTNSERIRFENNETQSKHLIVKEPAPLKMQSKSLLRSPSSKKKRISIIVPPLPLAPTTSPTAEVNICKFKFIGGTTPVLQEKKMFSVDSNGNYSCNTANGDKLKGVYKFLCRETLQKSGLVVKCKCACSNDFSCANGKRVSPTSSNMIDKHNELVQISGSSCAPFDDSLLLQQSNDGPESYHNEFEETPGETAKMRSQADNPSKANAKLTKLKIKQKSKARAQNYKKPSLVKTFKENGFLIQTQKLESAEGATYCKFRQLKKFTRYILRNWKDYLPRDLQKPNDVHTAAIS